MEELARDHRIVVAIDNLSWFGGAPPHAIDRTGIHGEFDFNLKYNESARMNMSLPNLPKLSDVPG